MKNEIFALNASCGNILSHDVKTLIKTQNLTYKRQNKIRWCGISKKNFKTRRLSCNLLKFYQEQ